MASSCPCCSFLLGEGLFLPEEQKNELSGGDTGAGSLLSSSTDLPSSPTTALHELILHARSHEQKVVLVDTHNHTHLERESQEIYRFDGGCSSNNGIPYAEEELPILLALSCAVEESDWDACLAYSSRSPYRRAALGVHPWYLGDGEFSIDENNNAWTRRLEAKLQQHPGLLVGEVGLCKIARWVRKYEAGKGVALELQRQVLQQQLLLAAKYQRPVSIHCVQQQGVLLELLQHLTASSSTSSPNDTLKLLPPTMAMHSFSGTAHQVQTLLKWEDNLFRAGGTKRNKKNSRKKVQETEEMKEDEDNISPSPAAQNPILYFGFSHSINYAMCSSEKSRRQGVDAIRAVPFDRLLVESDVHATDNTLLGTTGALAYVAWALDRPMVDVAQQTHKNALRFFSSLPEEAQTPELQS